MSKSEKITGNNEASLWRWLLAVACALFVGSIVGAVLTKIVEALPFLADGAYLAPERELLSGIASFAGIFLMFMVFVKVFCKTKLRDFLFGAGRKPDIKITAYIGLIFILGFILSCFVDLKYTSFECDDMKLWVINLVVCLAFLWIQTTTEEILFRGIFMRIFHGNEVPTLKKGIWPAVLSSLVFMSLHLFNPEVTQRAGAEAVFVAVTYFISGLCMYLPNLVVGGMEAGMLIHFLNNFMCFTVIKQEITVMPTPTLFVDHTTTDSGFMTLIMTLILYLPILVFSLLALTKKGKEEKGAK